MIIRILDIPPEGRDLHFEPAAGPLNRRVAAASRAPEGSSAHEPDYTFASGGKADLRLTAEGSTIIIKGKTALKYKTLCVRCAEETEQELDIDIDVILKPRPEKEVPEGALDEDLHFGFYENKEIDCGALVEEFVVLAIPYTVVCSEDCRGLCTVCGANLNAGDCACPPKEGGDERFALLRNLKLTH